MKIIYSPKCLEYSSPGHPESPERVGKSVAFLKNKGYEFVMPEPCSDDDIVLVHDKKLLGLVKSESFLDVDTPALEGIYEYAKLSAGGAIKAAQIALKGEKSFSLMRPPGHHAGRSFLGGFCYFNNIAIAVAKSLEKVGNVAILDIDCHHGNGTQDIFLGDSHVLYISFHQSPFYPGTGLKSEFNALNFPLPAGTGESLYLEKLDIALAKINKFKPNLLAISAGFDTYKYDPLTQFSLDLDTYRKVGKKISALNMPTFSVLEGGYSQDLPQCIDNFLQGLR
ncbi:histone deacetylase family protein [Patescibacteria group bacterium AH-259-L07]|nr:histone deacetylase family protein [Patescibacteria group bacterium AH-259-L07]